MTGDTFGLMLGIIAATLTHIVAVFSTIYLVRNVRSSLGQFAALFGTYIAICFFIGAILARVASSLWLSYFPRIIGFGDGVGLNQFAFTIIGMPFGLALSAYILYRYERRNK